MENNNLELENLVDELSSSLAESFFQNVNILSKLVLTTEKYYEGSHSRFISEKATLIAQELGMNDEEVTEIKYAALLHDIGLIGLPDPIHYKYPSELTQTEYNQYMLHSAIGYNILKTHNLYENIATIVYQHHEKLDGSGFPNHLQKDQIHPGAKIILVCDFYHNAMYKRQRQKNDTAYQSTPLLSTSQFLDATRVKYASTMNFLHKKAGILYEKKIVNIFTELIELERKNIGQRSVMRMPIHNIEPGNIFAEDYFTSYGLLVAAKGEIITKESINALKRFIENGEIPQKLLVIK